MVHRILVLPFHFVMLFWAVFTPFLVVMALSEGGTDKYVLALVLATTYPFALTWVHAARIEHFIARRLGMRKMAREFAKGGYLGKYRFAGAHDYLLRLLAREWEPAIDRVTYEKGLALARRHRWLAKMMWWGLGILVVALIIVEYTIWE